MENLSSPSKINNIIDFVCNLNLNDEEFKKIYEKVAKLIENRPKNGNLLEKIREKSKDTESTEDKLLSELLVELDSEDMLELFQNEDFNNFVQDFILKKVI
jgi:hypothetical protein